jgi:hypothetical protein
MSVLGAALAYAKGGWYVVPWHPVKSGGPYLGRGWPAFSSRDPEQIREWWNRWPDAAIAGHVGRSKLIVFDVDNPEAVPDVLRRHLGSASFQSTRSNDPERGHYVFRLPRGRRFGNSTGALGGGWGEVRGANGVIILAPSFHDKSAEGGRYLWRRQCDPTTLHAELCDALVEATPGEVALTNAALDRFLADHTEANQPGRLQGQINWFRAEVERGESRHHSIVEALCWAFRESVVGAYPAADARDELEAAFQASLVDAPGPNAISRPYRRSEFEGAAAWAAAQAVAADPEETRSRMNREPSEEDRREAVENAKLRLWANDTARQELAAEGWVPPPVSGSLAAQFADPLPENGYIVKEVAGAGMTILFIAQWKAGKTTAGFNLAVDLADGTPFLGRFNTALADGTSVAYWNFELDGRRAQDWFRDLDPANPERIHIQHWRGRSLPIETPATEDFAVQMLREQQASVLILDPISSAYEGEENSNTELRNWFKALERIKNRAGLELLILIAHAGHGGAGEDGEGLPRMRGGSKAMGDPDAFWFYQHGGEHGQPPPDSRRYFRAYGRDIDLPQITLDYDRASRRLFAVDGGGSRTNDRVQQMALAAAQAVQAHHSKTGKGIAKGTLEEALGKGKTGTKRAGIERATSEGWIRVEGGGVGNAILHFPGDSPFDVSFSVSK